MNLSRNQQDIVQVLYAAAARLLHSAGMFNLTKGDEASRDLNQNSAENCVKLAEQIAALEAIKITCDRTTSLEVENIPFDVGFVVNTKSQGNLSDDYREDVLHAIACRLVETLHVDADKALLAAEDIASTVPEIAAWLPPDPDFEVADDKG